MDDKTILWWAVGFPSVPGLGKATVQHCLRLGSNDVTKPMVKTNTWHSTHSIKALGLGSVRTCQLGVVPVLQAVDNHNQPSRSHWCHAMTKLLEGYGMLKLNEKSSNVTNGIRVAFECGNCGSVHSPTLFSLKDPMELHWQGHKKFKGGRM